MITLRLFHSAFEDQPVHVADYKCHSFPITPHLEDLFKATQNVNSNWVESNGQFDVQVNPTAKVQNAGGCRSTSVGDYVTVIDEHGLQIAAFSCEAVGWMSMTKE